MKNHIHYTQITSTNTLLKEMLQSNPALPNFSVVSADYQTSGRGQRENRWESASGQNLLFSILIKPQTLSATKAFAISQIVSVAIAKQLSNYISNIKIKWPNDIYCGDKKICGILIENSLMSNCIDSSVVGVGINVNQTDFSASLPNPTSLAILTEKTYCLEKVLEGVMAEIEKHYGNYFSRGESEMNDLYHNLLYRLNTPAKFRIKNTSVSTKNNVEEATIIGVESNGCLILKHADETIRSYAFKEIEYVI